MTTRVTIKRVIVYSFDTVFDYNLCIDDFYYFRSFLLSISFTTCCNNQFHLSLRVAWFPNDDSKIHFKDRIRTAPIILWLQLCEWPNDVGDKVIMFVSLEIKFQQIASQHWWISSQHWCNSYRSDIITPKSSLPMQNWFLLRFDIENAKWKFPGSRCFWTANLALNSYVNFYNVFKVNNCQIEFRFSRSLKWFYENSSCFEWPWFDLKVKFLEVVKFNAIVCLLMTVATVPYNLHLLHNAIGLFFVKYWNDTISLFQHKIHPGAPSPDS